MAAMEPLAEVASREGFEIEFSTDYSEPSEIGVYARNPAKIKSDLSVIMFHGIDDGYRNAYWRNHDWSKFDIGLLPGNVSVKNWKKQSYYPLAHPKIGVFTTGWPKTDRIYSKQFQSEIMNLVEEIGIKSNKTILYAPTSEDHGKIHDFITNCEHVADKMLIKHAPYEKLKYAEGYEDLNELYEGYQTREDIFIFDPKEDIMKCLGVADIVVSDQSSVLNESILTDTIPVSVVDWPIRSGGTAGNKGYQMDFVKKVVLSDLSDKIKNIYENMGYLKRNIKKERKQHYSHLGNSSNLTIDLISSLAKNEQPPVYPVDPELSFAARSYGSVCLKIGDTRDLLIQRLPSSVKRILKIIKFNRLDKRARNKIRKIEQKFLY